MIVGMERVGCTDCEAAGFPVALDPTLDTLNKHSDGKKHKNAAEKKKAAEQQQTDQAQDE